MVKCRHFAWHYLLLSHHFRLQLAVKHNQNSVAERWHVFCIPEATMSFFMHGLIFPGNRISTWTAVWNIHSMSYQSVFTKRKCWLWPNPTVLIITPEGLFSARRNIWIQGCSFESSVTHGKALKTYIHLRFSDVYHPLKDWSPVLSSIKCSGPTDVGLSSRRYPTPKIPPDPHTQVLTSHQATKACVGVSNSSIHAASLTQIPSIAQYFRYQSGHLDNELNLRKLLRKAVVFLWVSR